jgi:hypothetical protein
MKKKIKMSIREHTRIINEKGYKVYEHRNVKLFVEKAILDIVK